MGVAMLDGGGLGVLPGLADLPAVDTDAALLLEHADALRRVGRRVQSATEGTSGTWDRFRDLLVAPWAEPLHSRLRPVAASSHETATAMAVAGQALAEFAAEVRVLQTEREALEQRILAAQSGGLDVDPAGPEIDALRSDVAVFATRVTAAEEACVDALQASSRAALPYRRPDPVQLSPQQWERCTGIPRADQARDDTPPALSEGRLSVTDIDRCTGIPQAYGPGAQPTYLGTQTWNDWPRCTGIPTPGPQELVTSTPTFTTGPPCPRP